jgi:hypothetical protein
MKRKEILQNRLTIVAAALPGELDRLALVGGCASVFHLDETRTTEDIDWILELPVDTPRVHFYRFSERLRKAGFREDNSEARGVICRFRLHLGETDSFLAGTNDLVVDIMPTDPTVLDFSNRWYPEAFRTARWHTLSGELSIRVIEPIYLVATKLEAFLDRGDGDYDSSEDLEDVLMMLAHHEEVRHAVARRADEVSRFICDALLRMRARLLRQDNRALQAHLGADESAEQQALEMSEWLGQLLAE